MNAVTYIRIDGVFLLPGNKAKLHVFLSKNEYFIAFAYMRANFTFIDKISVELYSVAFHCRF